MAPGSRKRTYPSKNTRRRVIARDGYICQICWEEIDPEATDDERLSLDHIVAFRDGGSNTLDNLRVVHQRCNNERHNLPAECATVS